MTPGCRDPAPFLFGIEGTTATRATVALLRETRAAGVLLLARNIRSPAQLRALVRGLRERVGRALMFCVDHEGGWVLRFATGLTALPGNAALGRAGDAALARRAGELMGRELRSLGVGLNLAPVLDVVTERYNPGITIRSFGRDPALAARLGAAFVRGQQSAGVAACAKHFPGKGAAEVDSHLTLPVIRLSRREHEARHLAPFAAACRAGAAAVMTSHAAFPAYDRTLKPATFSRPIVEGLLRRRLGFEGAIVSDDLCMGAVTEARGAGGRGRARGVAEAALEALCAGHDLLMVAHGEPLQREAAGLLERALADGAVDSPRLAASRRRVARLLSRYAFAPCGPLPRPDRALPLAIARRALEHVPGRLPVPLPFGRLRSVAVLWPALPEVRERFTFEGGPGAPLRRLKARLARWKARVRLATAPIVEGEPRAALAAARGADAAVFFCFEALRFPAQRRLLDGLQRELPDRLAVCLLRNPWDRRLVKPGVTVLDAAGYRECQVTALVEALEGVSRRDDSAPDIE